MEYCNANTKKNLKLFPKMAVLKKEDENRYQEHHIKDQ